MPYEVKKQGDQWCVYREGKDKSLGCHATQGAAERQVRAILAATHAPKAVGMGMWITAAAMKAICPSCAAHMDEMGIDQLNLYALKAMPAHLLSSLCDKFGADEGFFTRCMGSSIGTQTLDAAGFPHEPEAFCAWLHKQCIGKWPGEKAAIEVPTIGTVLKAATIGGILESQMHESFTRVADALYGAGLLNREERIALSSAIGDGLEALTKAIDTLGLNARNASDDKLAELSAGKGLDAEVWPELSVSPPGGQIKSLGSGRVGGYLVTFSPQGRVKDLVGDYFTRSTRYHWSSEERRTALFHHGLDPTIGKREIGTGWRLARTDNVGLWVETQLDLRDEYEKAIHRLTQMGKLGLSSGTASHMIERDSDGLILNWPIVEGSFTPTPMEPRTGVVPLRSVEVVPLRALLAGMPPYSRAGGQRGRAKRRPGPGQRAGETVSRLVDILLSRNT